MSVDPSVEPAVAPVEKPWYKSLTIWGVIIAAVGVVVGQLSAGVEGLFTPEAQNALATILQAVGLLAATAGRVRATVPVTKSMTGQSGYVQTPMLVLSAIVGIALFAATACSQHPFVKVGGYLLDRTPSGETCLVMYGDGDPQVFRGCVERSPDGVPMVGVTKATLRSLCDEDPDCTYGAAPVPAPTPDAGATAPDASDDVTLDVGPEVDGE